MGGFGFHAVNAAVYALIANSCMAALFVVTYGVVAITYLRQRAAVWFMVSYLLGFLTPICELLFRFTDYRLLFAVLGYAAFLGAITVMSVGIQAFAGHRLCRRPAALLWVGGMTLRMSLLGGTRNSLPYEMLFQLPFALGSILVLLSIRRIAQKGPIRTLLMVVFGIIGAHFLAKPFMAASLGSGHSAQYYATSYYAVVSQVSTGVLLVAAGLFLMLLVIQKALDDTIRDAESDPLTGLANRRGLARAGPALLAEAKRDGHGLYAMVLDLDHFKRVNDMFGHAMGDRVLVAFADLLRTVAARDVLAVRLGGEEFALLVPDAFGPAERSDNRASHLAGDVRALLRLFDRQGLPPLTVSGGIVRHAPGETLDDLIARADQLAYRAKRAGRDHILHEPVPVAVEPFHDWHDESEPGRRVAMG